MKKPHILNSFISLFAVLLFVSPSAAIAQSSSSPLPLTKNVPASITKITKGNAVYYTFTLAPNSTSFSVRTTGGTGDVDIYLNKDTIRSNTSSTWKSQKRNSSSESILITSPSAGTYFLKVYAYSNAASTTVTMTYNVPVVVVTNNTLTLTKSGAGAGLVSSSPSGINCGSTCSSSFASGTVVTLTAAPMSATSTFTGWTGACSGTGSCVVTLNTAKSVGATFGAAVSNNTLTLTKSGTGSGTVTSSPAGINCGTTCSLTVASGTSVTLTASPASGSSFSGWTGACGGTTLTCTVALTSSKSAIATFTITPSTKFSLSQRVLVNSGPLNIRDTANGTLLGTQATNALGTVTGGPTYANALWWWNVNFDSGVDGWAAEGYLTATSTPIPPLTNTLTLTKSGTGSGTVTSSPAGINCGTTCSTTVASGTVVTLTASPTASSTFTGWTGACSGTGSCVVTLNTAKSVGATFTAQVVTLNNTLTLTKSGSGSGTITSSPSGIACGSTCSSSFASGTVVTLTATPSSTSTLTAWTGACSGSTVTCTVTMSAAQAVGATFTITPSTKFSLSQRVLVNSGPLNIRDTANGTLLGTQATNALGTVTGGPTYANALWWWNVNFDSGVDGWAAEGYLTATSTATTTTGGTFGYVSSPNFALEAPNDTDVTPYNAKPYYMANVTSLSQYPSITRGGSLKLGPVNDPDHPGMYALRHEVVSGDPLRNSGNRSELSYDDIQIKNGVDYWFAFAVKLDADWLQETSGGNSDRLSIMQVHQQSEVTTTGNPFGLNWMGTTKGAELRWVTNTATNAYNDSMYATSATPGKWMRVVMHYRSGPDASYNPKLETWVATEGSGFSKLPARIADNTPFGEPNQGTTTDWAKIGIYKWTPEFYGTNPKRGMYSSGLYFGQGTDLYNQSVNALTAYAPVIQQPIATSTKFTLTQRVTVNSGPLNIRDSANGNLLGTQSTNALGSVTGGPVYANSLWWWNVNFDSGVDGWAAESYLTATTTGTTATTTSTFGALAPTNIEAYGYDGGYSGQTITGSDGKARFQPISNVLGTGKQGYLRRIVQGDPISSGSGLRAENSWYQAQTLTNGNDYWWSFAVQPIAGEWNNNEASTSPQVIFQVHQDPASGGPGPTFSLISNGAGNNLVATRVYGNQTTATEAYPYNGPANSRPADNMWTRYIVHLRMSPDVGGAPVIQVWQNGSQIINLSGTNALIGQTNATYYTKSGMYKWRYSPTEFGVNQSRAAYYSDVFFGQGTDLYTQASSSMASFVTQPTVPAVLSAVPGTPGYGIESKGGRGGVIIKVTNLNNSGTGSLRACIDAVGPRTCVFEVAGTINLTDRLDIYNSYLTIAGQTAPSPGILIRGDGVLVWSAHDILIQHIQVRPGDNPSVGTVCSQRGAFIVWSDNNKESYNVVFDHVSGGWATDQTASTWGESDAASIHDITFSNSIFSEPLNNSCHSGGAHPMGPLLGIATKRVTMIGNIMAQHFYRNPLMNTGMTDGIIVNNLIYHPGNTGSGKIDMELNLEGYPGPFNYTIVGNTLIPRSNDSSGKIAWVIPDGPNNAQIYIKDNMIGTVKKDWDGVGSYGTINNLMAATTATVWNTGLTPISSSDIEARTLLCAGSRPAERDPIDTRVVNYIRARAGVDIDSPNQVGGYPTMATTTRVFTPVANPNGDDDGDGYTNLDEQLQQMSVALGACGIN